MAYKMTEKEKREKIKRAMKVGTRVTKGMKRPPGTEELGQDVVNGRLFICYYNIYRYPYYYVREIKCEKDLEPWK